MGQTQQEEMAALREEVAALRQDLATTWRRMGELNEQLVRSATEIADKFVRAAAANEGIQTSVKAQLAGVSQLQAVLGQHVQVIKELNASVDALREERQMFEPRH